MTGPTVEVADRCLNLVSASSRNSTRSLSMAFENNDNNLGSIEAGKESCTENRVPADTESESNSEAQSQNHDEHHHHDSFSYLDEGNNARKTYEYELEDSFASFEFEIDFDGDDDDDDDDDDAKGPPNMEESMAPLDCFLSSSGSDLMKSGSSNNLHSSGDCPPVRPRRSVSGLGERQCRSTSNGRTSRSVDHSSGDQPPSRPTRFGNSDDDLEIFDGENSERRRGRLSRNKSTKMTPIATPTTPGRKQRNSAPGAMSMSCSALTYDTSCSQMPGCPGTPLSRERSKLCRLSASNSSLSSSQHSSNSRGSRMSSGRTLPRRRTQQMTPVVDVTSSLAADQQQHMLLDGSKSVRSVLNFDGDASIAQLQVGDFLMLANKELSTSSHLRRRMPKRRSRQERLSARTRDEGEDRPREDEDEEADEVIESAVRQAINVVEIEE